MVVGSRVDSSSFGREVVTLFAREGTIRWIARCANFNDQVEVLAKSLGDIDPPLPMRGKVICPAETISR